MRLYSVLFMALVALATAECAQIVGVLLVFTLMVGPAAAAQRLTRRVVPGILLAMGLALAQAWAGLTLAFYTDWPTSFWISLLAAVIYLAALLTGAIRERVTGEGEGRAHAAHGGGDRHLPSWMRRNRRVARSGRGRAA